MHSLSTRWDTAEELWWATAIVLAGLFVLNLIAFFLDTRTIDGVSVWAKPLKFQASLSLHFATLAIIVNAFSSPWQQSDILKLVAVASIAATVFEIGYIMIQAAQQEHSHFNQSTPFYSVMYALMAIGAVVIVAAAAVVGLMAIADQEARLTTVLRHSIAAGLIGGSMLTLIVAFTMGSRLARHVGVELPDAPTMPLTGWSRSVGDLRVSHFFATHMMQAVPLAGLAAQAILPTAAALLSVWLFATAWAVVVFVTYRQALNGQPLGPIGLLN